MTHITAFSPENWVSEKDEKRENFKEDVRCLADYCSLEASVAVAQYIRPINNDGADDVCKRNERSQCKSLASLLEYMYNKKTISGKF